jgi:Zn-dependent protease with chaperone function
MVHALLIVAFVAVILRDQLGRSAWDVHPDRAFLGMVVAMAAVWVIAHLRIMLLGRTLDRTGSHREILRAERTLAASRVAITAAHVAGVTLGALAAVRARTGRLIVLDELLTTAPLLLFFVLGWWSIYPLERRLREAVLLRRLEDGRPLHPPPTRAAFVGYAVRHQMLLILVPLLCILAWHEGVESLSLRVGWPHRSWNGRLSETGGVILTLIQLSGVVVVFALMPLLLRHIWDTVRLGPGELREGLLALCGAHRVRVRDILVWRTGGQMLNGAVMGLAGPARYILLTDALLENMPPDQVDAVMAHEVGHVRRRHMIWLGVAALAGILAASIAADLILRQLPVSVQREDWVQMLGAGAALAIGLVLFGYVSRRFEWQADAFAVQHLSGHQRGVGVAITPEAVAHMTDALRAVCVINHIPPEKWTWRHGSIRTRQRKLAALVGQQAGRLGVDRQAAAIKWAAAAVLAASLALAAYDLLH